MRINCATAFEFHQSMYRLGGLYIWYCLLINTELGGLCSTSYTELGGPCVGYKKK